MSEHDETLAIGQLVKDAAAAKTRLTALKSDLERHSAAFQRAYLHVNGVIQEIDNPELERALREVPAGEAVLAECREYREQANRARELKSRVDTFGV